MTGRDPAHWLYRLSPAEWLAAADNDLAQAFEALRRRAARPGVVHARRAAGMAWNAALVDMPEPEQAPYGRSYMEHVLALAADGSGAPDAVRAAARRLRDTPPAPPELVSIHPDLGTAEAARVVVEHARAVVAARGTRS
jgi:hypothetical protein